MESTSGEINVDISMCRGTFCQGYKCMSTVCDAAVHKECILGSKCGKRTQQNNLLATSAEPKTHLGEPNILV